MMFFIKPPWIYRKLLPSAVFNMPDQKVYLTFDDGPDLKVTSQVLDILAKENVSATFFLLGRNAEAQPELLDRIRAEGHSIGNHGYDHLDGWNISGQRFRSNVTKGAQVTGSDLFRPPYGRVWPWQLAKLRNVETIMWSVLSGDFDVSLEPEQVVRNVVDHTEPGSIIVLHDSKKAKSNVLASLPSIISELKAKGFSFGKLKQKVSVTR